MIFLETLEKKSSFKRASKDGVCVCVYIYIQIYKKKNTSSQIQIVSVTCGLISVSLPHLEQRESQ